MRTFIVFSLALFLNSNIFCQTLESIYDKAVMAYKAKDYLLFLEHMQVADSIRPNHPTLLYNLATAFILNKKEEKALYTLRKALWLNAKLNVEKDQDWTPLHGKKAFTQLIQEQRNLNEELKLGTIAMTLSDSTFHPEGIAYHEKTGDFYIGSIHHRKVIRIDTNGVEYTLSFSDSLYAVMGIKIDQRRQLLWICSTKIPEMKNYKEGTNEPDALIICYDLLSQQLKTRYEVSDTMVWLGDLAIAPNGDVFASNSLHPTIYRVDLLTQQLSKWLEIPGLCSLQGLTFSQEGDYLFLADYREGLFQVNVKTQIIKPIKNLSPHPLKGIDGLYFYHNQLVAIHNGIYPNRVVGYQLNRTFDQIHSYRFLDKALKEYGEPTLGVISESYLFYIANSPWQAYDKDHQQINNRLKKPIIIKTKL